MRTAWSEILGKALLVFSIPALAVCPYCARSVASNSRAGIEQLRTSATTDIAQPIIVQLWREAVEVRQMPTGKTALQPIRPGLKLA